MVAWSRATTAKTLELITAKTTDAVTAFLDTDYLQRMVRELEAAAGRPVTDPDTTIKTISTKLRYSDDQAQAILQHFIAGADISAGGILHAITSVAQTLTDADAAHEMESTAIQAMHLGVLDFLAKPLRQSELMAAIERSKKNPCMQDSFPG